MKLPTSRMLYDYWNDVRGQRLAPSRFEIEPSQIAGVLSETFILERTGAGHYPFRLAGTRICEHIGRELRGSDFLDLAGDGRPFVTRALAAATEQGAIALIEIEGVAEDGRTAAFEVLLLPLRHPANEITRFLGSFAAIDPPGWLGLETLRSFRTVNHEVRWPAGRQIAAAEDADRQLPFAPELASARIVRSERRQFRILDGGRKH